MCRSFTTSQNNKDAMKATTCNHCVSSVAESVSQIDGTDDGAADTSSGSLTFPRDQAVDPEKVGVAFVEAGYGLEAA